MTNNDLKILKITNQNFKDKEFEEIDELIYEFNNGSFKISNWIEFKIFANKIILLMQAESFFWIYNFFIFFFIH